MKNFLQNTDTVFRGNPHLKSRRVQKRLGQGKGPTHVGERLKGECTTTKSYRARKYKPRVSSLFYFYSLFFVTVGRFRGSSVKSTFPVERCCLPHILLPGWRDRRVDTRVRWTSLVSKSYRRPVPGKTAGQRVFDTPTTRSLSTYRGRYPYPHLLPTHRR